MTDLIYVMDLLSFLNLCPDPILIHCIQDQFSNFRCIRIHVSAFYTLPNILFLHRLTGYHAQVLQMESSFSCVICRSISLTRS